MIELLLFIIIVFIALCLIMLIYISRLIDIKEFKHDKEKQRTFEDTHGTIKQKKITVAQLSPEEIVPAIRTPPRPQGGFGVVIRSDDNTQIREANCGEIRSKSDQTENQSSDSATQACKLPTTPTNKPRNKG